MSIIKQQLRDFYRGQGLKPNEMRSAIRYDMRSIRKQRGGWRSGDMPLRCLGDVHWYGMAEGPGYWLSRDCGFPSASYRGKNHPLRTIR